MERAQGLSGGNHPVYFIGAGPGAPDLLTVRAAALLERCNLCLYAGSLIPEAVLDRCPRSARLVDTQGLELGQIVELIAEGYRAGELVVRLHSGDLSIYSALTEQLAALREQSVPCELVPGVSAFGAAAAALGRELTVPGVAQTVILTRYGKRATPVPSGERLEELAAHGTTLVVHLGGHALAELERRLLPAYGPHCPAAVVANASWGEREVVVEGPLGGIAERAARAGVRRNALLLVGRALVAEDGLRSHLYSPQRRRGKAGGGA